ncbi:MAG: 4'-phosphopantetheinyl transferase superfamily protein [Acidobacteriota bacterium]
MPLQPLPDKRPSLSHDRIDLLATSLNIDSSALEEGCALLSVDERERADRFRFPRHARRFIHARAFMRRTLSWYLDRDPAALRFNYGPEGKPSLPFTISFNQSDSEELAVLAVTLSRQVGVDIESLRSIANAEELAHRFFSPGETRDLMAITEEERDRAFLACWTRKEAYLKATGEGLTRPLSQFRVVVDPCLEPRLISVELDPAEERRWSMAHLEPGVGYIGALVIEGRGASVHWVDGPFVRSF